MDQNYIPYVAVFLSFLSLLISATTLYMAQFRKPNISISLGPDVHLYHPANGGSALYLPVIFSNKSPTKGIVKQIFLQVKTPDNVFCYMKWLEECTITIRDWSYSENDRVKPFTIDGFGNVSKVFWFNTPAVNNQLTLPFKAGKYVFTLLVWTEDTELPQIQVSEELELSKAVEAIFIKNLEDKDSTTRIFNFPTQAGIAIVTDHSNLSKLHLHKGKKKK